MAVSTGASDVDAYLAGTPQPARETLEGLRQVIRAAVPEAVESIGYGMPAYKYRGKPLIYFAAAKKHCALYGTVEGTIRFPPGEPPSAQRVRALLMERMKAIEAGKRVE